MVLKSKRGYIRCDFEKGAVSGLGTRAASFTTDNKDVQDTIEQSDKFKQGVIKLVQVYEETKPASGNEAGEVTTLQEARKYLLEKGVTMEELQNKAAVLEKAKELNITFPNWK